MTAIDPTAADWERREALLDQLLDLPEAERKASLQALAGRNAEDARVLGDWLQGITQSGGNWIDAATAPTGHAGAVVGNWRVLSLLGRGGMGEVWLGERADGLFEKQVAIKFIRDDNPALREGIEAERRLLAGLHHPGIVRLLDAGTTAEGRRYLVTDYIAGMRLDTWLRDTDPDLPARLDMFRQIAAALAHAHEQLIVHRDIKPGNVLVDAAGRAHLLDFGIARAIEHDGEGSQPTRTVLTPEFAAPEFVTGGRIGVRADVYALGGLLYFLLCGQPPLALRDLPLAAMVARIRDDAPAPLLARMPARLRIGASRRWLADLEAIACKALSKNPAWRYGTVEAMMQDIDAAGAQRMVSARAPGFGERSLRFLRRNRLAVGVAGLVALALLLGLAGTLWQAQQARQQRDLAAAAAARAEAEARTALAVRDFMVGVFESVNPETGGGAVPTALELVEVGVRKVETDLDDAPALQAELFAALGETWAGLGRYDQAQPLLRRALDTADGALGEKAPASRRILTRYAHAILLNGGPYDDVRPRLEQALAQAEPTDAQAAALLAQTRAFYGGILHKTGQLDQAATVLQEATLEARAAGQAGQTALITALHEQVRLAEARGHRMQAIAGLRELLRLHEQQPVRSRTDEQMARLDLANLLSDAGRGDEAETILHDLVATNTDLYGSNHPATITANITLARALQRRGQSRAACVLMEDMVALSLQQYGPGSDSTLLARTNLAALEHSLGHHRRAITLIEQVRPHVIARDGARSPRALVMLQNTARLRVADGDLDAARTDLEQLLDDLRAINSDATAEPLALLGDIARQQGDPARARDLHRQALEAYAATGDTGSIDVHEHRLSLAEDERDLGDLRAARDHAEQGLRGLLRLEDVSSDGMVAYARYVLAQLDTLEQRCTADSRTAMDALLTRQGPDESAPPPDATDWRIARLELSLGLCRRSGVDAVEGDCPGWTVLVGPDKSDVLLMNSRRRAGMRHFFVSVLPCAAPVGGRQGERRGVRDPSRPAIINRLSLAAEDSPHAHPPSGRFRAGAVVGGRLSAAVRGGRPGVTHGCRCRSR